MFARIRESLQRLSSQPASQSKLARVQVERLESRCVLSAVPITSAELVDWSPPKFDVELAPIARELGQGDGRWSFWLDRAHLELIEKGWSANLPSDHGSEVRIPPGLQLGDAGQGGYIEFSQPEMPDLGQMFHDGAAQSEVRGVSEMLSTLKYRPEPFRDALILGGGTAAAAESLQVPGVPRDGNSHAQSAANKILPGTLGDEQVIEPPQHLGDTDDATAKASSQTSAAESTNAPLAEGGMVALVREVVVDETATAVGGEQVNATTKEPSRIESAYGKFQAFEVSSTEEIPTRETVDSHQGQPLPEEGSPATTSRHTRWSPQNLAAVDQVFAMIVTTSHEQGDGLESRDELTGAAMLPKAQGAQTEVREARSNEAKPQSGDLTSTSARSAMAALLVATAAGATIRPRRRSKPGSSV